MTDQEIRIAIAEAFGCKWTEPVFEHDGKWRSWPYFGENHYPSFDSSWAGEPKDVIRKIGDLPDYPNDLNAMHKAEKCVIHAGGTWIGYISELNRVCTIDGVDLSWHATARQRAEAFLRTIGKWKE